MNPSMDSFEKIVQFRLEPEIYNFRLLKELSIFSKTQKVKVRIHIKLDTGMHRLGFMKEDLNQMIALIKVNPYIQIVSVFSHLAGADDENLDLYTTDQVSQYIEEANRIEKAIQSKFIRHVANSAAIIRNPEYHFDMVRLGIGLYGFDASGIINQRLRPIGVLKTEISQIINLKKGESVGYGRKGRVSRNSKIATVAIGYADGYSRLFSNGIASMLVNGKLAPVIGNVCMDMTMIDITGIKANEGSEVIVFGNTLSLSALSKTINTIPYEILTNISDRVKRIYISE
jgi:alanine racemase